jgi:hypothetical protein
MFLFILIIRLVSSARIPKALHGLNPLNLIVAVTLKSYIAWSGWFLSLSIYIGINTTIEQKKRI